MILKQAEFCEWIERYRQANRETYMDSIIAACERFSVDYDSIKQMLNIQIVTKLEAEAKKLNFIKSTVKKRLPVERYM